MKIDQSGYCEEGRFEQIENLSDNHYTALSLMQNASGGWDLVGAADVGEDFEVIASFKHENHGVFFAQQMQAIDGPDGIGGPPFIELSNESVAD